MLTHIALLNSYLQLDYEYTPGICYGISVEWIKDCLLDTEAQYTKRIERIIQLNNQLAELVKCAKGKKECDLDEQDKEVLDINNFYKQISVFHSRKKPEYILTPPPDKIKSTHDLNRIFSELNIYTDEELINYFNELKEILDKTAVENGINEPLGFVISNHIHAMGLTYHVNKGWGVMDINQYPPQHLKKEQTRELVQLIKKAFQVPPERPPNKFTAVDISLVVLEENAPQFLPFKDKLNSFKASHKITDEIVAREIDGMNLAIFAAAMGDTSLLTKLGLLHSNLSCTTSKQATPAHLAAEYGHAPAMKVLGQFSANLNMIANGTNPAYVAAQNGHDDVIDVLGELKANLENPENERSPLLIAAQRGFVGVVKKLIKFGVNLNRKDAEGATPAFTAAEHNHPEIIALLGSAGADLDQPIKDGSSPAHKAASLGHNKVITELGRQGANLNAQDPDGHTPAHIAVIFNKPEAISELANNDADLNSTDNDNATAFFYATVDDNADTVEQLLKLGADPNIAIKVSPERLDALFMNEDEDDDEETEFFKIKLNELKKSQMNAGQTSITITPYQIAQLYGNSRITTLIEQHNEKLKSLKESSEHFFALLPQLEELKDQLALKMDAEPQKYTQIHDAILALYAQLVAQGTLFFNNPTPKALQELKTLCLMESSKQLAHEHRGIWYQLNPILRSILGILSALTIIPMLASAFSLKEGFVGTFFASPRPATEKNLDELQRKMELELSKI